MSKTNLIFQNSKESEWLSEELFTQLFTRYWKKLFRFCRHHIQDDESSKEIVQQVFLSLWERRDTVDIQVNIGHYLFSAARFKIAHHFREETYRKQQMSCIHDHFCEFSNHTEEIVRFEDLNRYVNSLLERLPCRCREVYTLSRKKGLKIPEIAHKLDISEKTVEAHLTKALRFLREEIKTES